MRLQNKVALISGGARGMGAAEARMFAREGARVVIGDVLEADGRQVEAEINETGGECVFIHLDVTQESDWQKAVAMAVTWFGKLDVLVNNAGIYPPEGRVEDTGEELWDRIMEINAKGVFLGTKHAIPEMRKAGGGSIVNISSTAGLIGSSQDAAYTASKGAVRIFTKSTAIQYAKEGIRANSVHPGSIDTPMVRARMTILEMQRRAEALTPLGRSAHPDEVAYGVLFLASDESSFMTGSELVIDGGYTAQ